MSFDLKGQVFNRLTIIERTSNNERGHRRWICVCKCGNSVIATTGGLRSGGTQSCGCYGKEQRLKSHRIKHGHARGKGRNSQRSAEYSAWVGMRERCSRVKNKRYKDYGGRGITVCDRWQGEHGFENFLTDVGPRPTAFTKSGRPEFTLDRWPNKNGNYEPGNVRWATYKEQNKNRRKYQVLTNFSDEELRAEIIRRKITMDTSQ